MFTDKLVAQIPSSVEGTVREVYYEIDDVIPVGSVILDLEFNDEGVEEDTGPYQMSAAIPAALHEKVETIIERPKGGKAIASPAARHRAKSLGIEISKVQGTGHSGRVTKEDIVAFSKGLSLTKVIPSKTQTIQTPKASTPPPAPLTGITNEDQVKKIGGVKKGMTKTMTESLKVPIFGFSDDYEASNLIKMRKEMKKQYEKLTMLPFFIKALSIGMKEFPLMNINVSPETDDDGYIKEYVIKGDHNFSVAIDSPHGLLVPVVRQIQNLSILEINDCLRELRDKAGAGTLGAADFADSTFSVSSVGNLGGKYFVPTIL